MKKQAESWVNAANDDLLVIKEIIDNTNLTHMVAFHSQQAVEKSIKAILEEKEANVPRIHNIIVLKEKIENYLDLELDKDIFDQINELYIDSRYPTDFGLLPEVVLMDIRIPYTDGIEATRIIQNQAIIRGPYVLGCKYCKTKT